MGSARTFKIEFNTVDGYQGREVDILIFSTVRAPVLSIRDKTVGQDNTGIGFVRDVRRMNVALTRARFSLWIVGNATTLQQNPDWAALISDAKTRQLYYPVKNSCVFEEGGTAQMLRMTSLCPDPYLDKSTINKASAVANAEHIAMLRSSEMGCVTANSMERVGREHIGLEGREGIDFVKSATQPRRVEKAAVLENGNSPGTRSVEKDSKKQSQEAHGRRIESAVNEPRMQKNNSVHRGDRNVQLRTSVTRDDDEKERISRRHPNGTNDSPCPMPSDRYSLGGQERPRLKDAEKIKSSHSRKDVGPRTGRSGTESRGADGSVNDRAFSTDKMRSSLSGEPRTELRGSRVSAVGTTITNQDSSRTRPKVEGIGRDRFRGDRIERSRPSSHNHNGQSFAGVFSASSLLNSRQRAEVRPTLLGSASASRDEGPRAPTEPNNRDSPQGTSHMREREENMRALHEEKQTGNTVRDRSDGVEYSGSDRRPRHAERPDSDLQTNQARTIDLDRRTKQTANRDADRNDQRRIVHPPKKQKVSSVAYHFGQYCAFNTKRL